MTRHFVRGFTLIELMTIIAFIAILGAIAFPVFISAVERAKITHDMNNLRQIGLATQTYLSDNDNNLFSSSASWMSQLHPIAGSSGTKYLPGWNVFQSPFDKRQPLDDDTNSPVSYGLNGNGIIGMAAAKISKPSVFILFAPAQNSAATVQFSGAAGTAAPGVTVYKNAVNPSGPATGGPQNNRQRINAVFADLHCESLPWSMFINDSPSSSDPSAAQRWSP